MCTKIKSLLLLSCLLTVFCADVASAQGRRRMVAAPGKPAEIQLTPYKTTMIANGKDEAVIGVKIIDNQGNEVPGATKAISFHIKGDGHIETINGADLNNATKSDTLWTVTVTGHCNVIFQSGHTRSFVKFQATADSLYTGSTDIAMIFPGIPHAVTTATYKPRMVHDKILGADISFLPELEARGVKFSDKGVQKDAIEILKDHGFNYIRLRIFNEPANPKGYSPGRGFCDLAHTKAMAKRVKAAGLKFLLDFHYTDYWADPGQQNKPAAWAGEDFPAMKKSLHDYTVKVMQELKDQGTTPDMVQVGNEINHGMVWPEGNINNLDSLAQLIYAGVTGVREVSPATAIMLHIALGGQNAESRFWLDNMTERKVPFDVIGLSYYPKWHGTLIDLKNNMADLASRYHRQVMVAEYTQLKKQVNDIAFTVPDGKSLGTFIWEPLSTWEQIFDRDGKTNDLINVYPELAKKYDVR
jgi:beta-galactosidase